MAGILGAMRSGSVALVGGTAQTVLQMVAPTNQRLKLIGWDLSFDGTNSANNPCVVQVCRQTGGTFTNTNAPVKMQDATGTGETLQASFKTACTVEPTVGDILEEITIPVFGGTAFIPFTPSQEIHVLGGTLLGFKLNAQQNVNARVTAKYEE